MTLFYRRRATRWVATNQIDPAQKSWWELHCAATDFGLIAGYTREDVELAFRRLALKAHPDKGGTEIAFQALVAQRDLLLSQAEDRRLHVMGREGCESAS